MSSRPGPHRSSKLALSELANATAELQRCGEIRRRVRELAWLACSYKDGLGLAPMQGAWLGMFDNSSALA